MYMCGLLVISMVTFPVAKWDDPPRNGIFKPWDNGITMKTMG